MPKATATSELPICDRRHHACAIVLAVVVGGHALSANATAGRATWYVNQQAIGDGDGTTWGSAFRDIRDALDTAFWGDEIWVAAGAYTPDRGTGARDMTYTIPSGVRVYGGFGGVEARIDQRDTNAFLTILSGDLNDDDGPGFANRGDNSIHVLRITNAGIETLLDGFTIRGGNADGFDPLGDGSGGGLFSSGGLTICNSVFIDNFARHRGGGVYNLDGSPVISDCAFIANRAAIGGGVVVFGTGFARVATALHGTPRLTDCTFVANHATARAGAMYTTGGSENLVLNTCTFIGNTTDGFGGALVNDGAHHTMTSCLFNGNSAVGRAGAVSNGTTTTFNACTFVANTGSDGGAIHSDFFRPELIGCILWGNFDDDGGAGQPSQIAGPRLPIISFSCVQGWDGTWGGIGNIGDDPLFANPLGPDGVRGTLDDSLRLSTDSPCINTGRHVPEPFDLDGHARILCGQVDMGAFEFGIGDANCNGIIDLSDFARWASCRTLVQGAPLGVGCNTLDFDGDLDVDLVDFAGFQLTVMAPR